MQTSNKHFCNLFKTIDTVQVASISIFGYCDDRGSENYNLSLSNQRAKQVKQLLNNGGVKLKILLEIQGKGKVALAPADSLKNLDEVRKNNRRVDVVLNLKNGNPVQINGVYFELTQQSKRGDRIYLKNIQFPIDRSILTPETIIELNKLALQLNKFTHIHIEIQGHVCCTKGSKEALDIDTGKEELSNNRAHAVFKYLVSKKVDPKRMRFKGYGNRFPLGKDPHLDKRVEFLITRS
ncbi:OmpA family protein [Flavobacterium agricola]|nr:OmpA family protein [Flavobacterium agricola]